MNVIAHFFNNNLTKVKLDKMKRFGRTRGCHSFLVNYPLKCLNITEFFFLCLCLRLHKIQRKWTQVYFTLIAIEPLNLNCPFNSIQLPTMP